MAAQLRHRFGVCLRYLKIGTHRLRPVKKKLDASEFEQILRRIGHRRNRQRRNRKFLLAGNAQRLARRNQADKRRNALQQFADDERTFGKQMFKIIEN